MRLHPLPLEMTPVRVAVVMRPVGEGRPVRKRAQMPRPAPISCELLEDRPEIPHMHAVLPRFWCSGLIDRHPEDLHHRLQTAFRAEPVQLIGVRPAVVLEQQLRVRPVTAMGVVEVSGVRHLSSISLPAANPAPDLAGSRHATVPRVYANPGSGRPRGPLAAGLHYA